MADDQWARDAVRQLAEKCRHLRSDAVRSVSDEKYRGQAPPAVGIGKPGPSGVAERYRSLPAEEKASRAKAPGTVTRVEPSSRSELGELKAPSPVKKIEKGGRER
jgi:hypothetical protein